MRGPGRRRVRVKPARLPGVKAPAGNLAGGGKRRHAPRPLAARTTWHCLWEGGDWQVAGKKGVSCLVVSLRRAVFELACQCERTWHPLLSRPPRRFPPLPSSGESRTTGRHALTRAFSRGPPPPRPTEPRLVCYTMPSDVGREGQWRRDLPVLLRPAEGILAGAHVSATPLALRARPGSTRRRGHPGQGQGRGVAHGPCA